MSDIMTSSGVIDGSYGGRLTNPGVPSNGTSEVQTLTIGGTPTAGTITPKTAAGKLGAVVTWSATNSTLLSRLQTSLDGLFGTNNCVASAGTLTAGIGTITLTYGLQLGSLDVATLQVVNGLTGTLPTAAVTVATAGVTATQRGALPGTELQDTTNGDVYINQGTQFVPEWNKVTTS